MNNKKQLTVSLTRGESAWGWVYMPFYLVLLAPALMMILEPLGWDYTSAQGSAYLNGVYFLVNFLVAVIIFHKFLGQNLAQVSRRFWGYIQAVILGLVMYYVGVLLVNLAISRIAPDLTNPNDEYIVEMAQATKWIMLPGTVILAPVAEECFIRGLLFRGVYDRSRVWAYALSTAVFAVIHMLSYVGTVPGWQLLLCIAQYIPAGIALAWAYERADSIFAPILMHSIINGVSMWLSM